MNYEFDGISLFAENGYRLDMFCPPRFLIPDNSAGLVVVSARNMDEYPIACRQVQKDKTYVEIGPGLGEFIPFLVHHGIKPIAIDFFNYELGRSMLEYVKKEQYPPEYEQFIDVLLERIDIILDQKKVQLYNMKLGDAVRNNALHGCADFVVDNYGADQWPRTEQRGLNEKSRQYVYSLECKLLRKEGNLVTASNPPSRHQC